MDDSPPFHLVLLEDSADDAEMLIRELRRAGVDCLPRHVDTETAFLAALDPVPDVILADYRMPGFGALAALRELAARALDLPVIVVSGTIGEEAAVECLREGATDYLLKDRLGRLGQAVRNAVGQARLRSEQRRLAAALRASAEHYRLLFEESPHPIWLVDAETLRFVEVNRQAVSLYGYSRDEFLAMTLLEIRPVVEIPGTLQGMRAVLAGEPHVGRRRHRTKTGQLIEVSVASRVVDFGGRRALLAVVDDVTERHRLEEQLRQAQKLEAVGQLAGGVAHDFNNLLTAVLGYAGLAAERLADRPQVRQLVDEITRAGERGAALTRQLLTFSRLSPLQPRIIDLNAVVRGIETMLRRLIGDDIGLETRLRAAGGRVLADPGQLEQVIVNLAVNARDAMPDGGHLVIETADAGLDAHDAGAHAGVLRGPHVLLAVSDSGCGMDAATRARLFEPFFSTKAPGKGTGLGLATVFGIVQQGGGRIEVESEPGSGASFRIYLPRAAGAVEAPEPASAVAHRQRGGWETVLVLEDEPVLRQLVRTLLEGGGYRVLAAETVAAALSLAERHRGSIHLLLTDVVMPGLSGPEVAERLVALRPEIRVLYMSGYTGDLMGRRGMLPPGAALLVKPFTQASILRSVREVLDHSRRR
jgi:two-component system cell cycle sensor histidine kinase/response regulator CckA